MPKWYLNCCVGSESQVANTWPKITARNVYPMVRNGKEPENLVFSSVAATFEKAKTYVFAESPSRNAEVSGSSQGISYGSCRDPVRAISGPSIASPFVGLGRDCAASNCLSA